MKLPPSDEDEFSREERESPVRWRRQSCAIIETSEEAEREESVLELPVKSLEEKPR